METITVEQARSLSPLTLAFYGDSVYEVFVRQKIVLNGSTSVGKLHKMAVEKVNAGFQSYAISLIEPLLTEAETDIYKRGRNANGNSIPRSSNPRDYRKATGLEALFGYLHLIGANDRMNQLFEVIYSGTPESK